MTKSKKTKNKFISELLNKISEMDKQKYGQYLNELYEMLEDKYDIYIWYN